MGAYSLKGGVPFIAAVLSLAGAASAHGLVFNNIIDTPSGLSFDFVVRSDLEEVVEELYVPVQFTHQAGVQLRRITPAASDFVFQVNLAHGGSGGPGPFEIMYFLLDEYPDDFDFDAAYSDFTGQYTSLISGRTLSYSVTGFRDTGGGWEGASSGHLTLTVVPDGGSTLALFCGAGLALAGLAWLDSTRAIPALVRHSSRSS